VRSALDLFDQARAVTWRLLHPGRWSASPGAGPRRGCPCPCRWRWLLPLPLPLTLSQPLTPSLPLTLSLSLPVEPAAVAAAAACRCHGPCRTSDCSIGRRPLERPTSQRPPPRRLRNAPRPGGALRSPSL